MKVKELIKQLSQCEPDEEIFIWNGNWPWENYEPVKRLTRQGIRRSFDSGGGDEYDRLVIS